MTNYIEAVYSEMGVEPLIHSSSRPHCSTPRVELAGDRHIQRDADVPSPQFTTCSDDSTSPSLPTGAFSSSDVRFWSHPSMDEDSSFEQNCSPDSDLQDTISMITFDYEEEPLYERNIVYRLLVDLGATIDCGLFLGWSAQRETRQNCMALKRESA